MKVLLASREYPPETGWGGIGSYTYALAHALRAQDTEVHVVSCTEEASESSSDGGITIHRIRPAEPGFLGWRLRSVVPQVEARLSVARAVARAARDIQPDVVEAADWMAEGLIAGLSPGVPVVVHLHSPLDLVSSYRSAPRTLDTRLAGALERLVLLRAKAITAAEPEVIRWPNGNKWTKRVVHRMPPALTPDLVEVFPHDQERPPTVLMVGRLDELKAPDVLVHAMLRLKDEIPDLRAVLVGSAHPFEAPDGSDFRDWIKGVSSKEGLDIDLVGHLPRSEVITLYRSARLVVVPSHYESFSMTAVEAMACGTPVTVTDRCGIARWLGPLGPGFVVPPGEPLALSNAMRPWLSDAGAAERAGEAARRLVLEEFDPAKIARARIELYSSLV